MRRRIAVPTKDDIKVTLLQVVESHVKGRNSVRPVLVDIAITFHFVGSDEKPSDEPPVTLNFHYLSAEYYPYLGKVENQSTREWAWIGNSVEDKGLLLRWGKYEFSSTIGVLEPVICEAILEAILKQKTKTSKKPREKK